MLERLTSSCLVQTLLLAYHVVLHGLACRGSGEFQMRRHNIPKPPWPLIPDFDVCVEPSLVLWCGSNPLLLLLSQQARSGYTRPSHRQHAIRTFDSPSDEE